ncbi:MAG: YicC family protein [Defluviitaleaceae bacterium]|nr:YicC family protein [Defluviitaleaceae bacterium]
MVRSMTGFGRSESFLHDRRFKVEMKSVNHRFSDFSIKAPRFLNPFEDRIRSRLAQNITRGKVDMWINFESFKHDDMTVHVNEVYADAYMSALSKLSTRYRLGEMPLGVALELMAKVPEIIIFDRYESVLSSETARNEIWENLSEALDLALAQFNQMREAEGEALVRDMEKHHSRICELIKIIRKRVPFHLEEQSARLHERVNELMSKFGGNPDDGRLLTEVAIQADKSDINEELARLESHLKQFTNTLGEEHAIGRKMDFLVQEMNREVNTIGSKSTDIELTKSVVELKSLIEKIREQVQNIE